MSTLEVACGRCEKKFRVRVEFAGRSTRCPGCSAPINIAGPVKVDVPLAARRNNESKPQPKRRPRDDDDEPQPPVLDWNSVDTAFRREQLAVIFVFVSIFGDIIAACLSSMAGPNEVGGLVLVVSLLMGLGPTLIAAVFAFTARLAAMGAPRETLSRASAVASLLCCCAGLVCIAGLGLTILASIDAGTPGEAAMTVTLGGTFLSGASAVATFMVFTAQIGIYRKSAAISRGIASTGIAIAVSTLVLIFIGIFYTVVAEVPDWGSTHYYRDHSPFYRAILIILAPIGLAVVLIFYHRLLAAGRRSIGNESTASRSD